MSVLHLLHHGTFFFQRNYLKMWTLKNTNKDIIIIIIMQCSLIILFWYTYRLYYIDILTGYTIVTYIQVILYWHTIVYKRLHYMCNTEWSDKNYVKARNKHNAKYRREHYYNLHSVVKSINYICYRAVRNIIQSVAKRIILRAIASLMKSVQKNRLLLAVMNETPRVKINKILCDMTSTILHTMRKVILSNVKVKSCALYV